jgi:hypothetical protein
VVHIGGVNVAELRHRHTRGVVIGAGLERRFGAFRLTPEVRFTRWADRNFGVHDARYVRISLRRSFSSA